MVKVRTKPKLVEVPLKLDLGCGKNKKEGFVGVDIQPRDGVDHVIDLREPWPFADDSVEEAYSAHFLEHLTNMQRVHFVNELCRVLKKGATCQIAVPHWSGCRAYGDPTHQWPPVTEFWFFYLNQEWRDREASHVDVKNMVGGFTCDFDTTWGYSLMPAIQSRSQEFQQFAVNHYREAIADLVATLTKR